MHLKDTIVHAFTEMAPHYEQKVDGELQRFWGWSYSGFVNKLLDLTPFSPEDLILDIATGTCVIPRELIRRGKTSGQIVGLDLTPGMLLRGKHLIGNPDHSLPIRLTCGSAIELPLCNQHFDVVTCGLASHHMDVSHFLAEVKRVLKPGGSLTVADVGASRVWRNMFVVSLIRIAAFIYFLPVEGISRAFAEAESLSHIYTAEEWQAALLKAGFTEIHITRLPTNHFWSPVPLILHAT
ncbi:MAG: methyltransferase domain-containing protein [Anaerolineaceae bacterium]|nr:methyltransferase domain-containing protein [Anaerolineaceae bacterium]